MEDLRGTTTRLNVVLLLASLVVIIAGMRAASAIIVPFLLSVFIAVMCTGPFSWMRRKGIPPAIAIVLIISVILSAIFGLGTYIWGSLIDLSEQLPRYRALMLDELINLIVRLRKYGIYLSQQVVIDYFDTGSIMEIIANILSGVGNILVNAILIMFTVVFVLLESPSFLAKIKSAFNVSPHTLEVFDFIIACVKKYLGIKTWISLATGISVMLWLMAVGVKYPVLFGVTAFLLHYIPNIGSLIAAVPAVLLALVDSGLGTAGLTIVGYSAVNLVFGNILEPIFMGRGLSLSTLVVFLSLIFWGWVLGPVGMLLSAPLTMIFKITCESFPSSRWIGILLDAEAPLPLDMPHGQTGVGRNVRPDGQA